MKTKIAALCLIAFCLPAHAQDDEYWDDPNDQDQAQVDVSVDPGASASFSTFHDGLAPYGEWVDVGPYGRVWRPLNVAAGWRPYYYGRWEWTDEGWLWVSDEPWGWAAYHYGRWAYDSSYGWIWIPGYQWAPAWVTWRYGPDYIGWAPLGPGFSVYVTSYPVIYNWWTFVPCQRFVAVPVNTVAFSGSYVRSIWRGTRPAPPRATIYGGARGPAWGGPARPFVETRIGRPIAPVRIQPVASPAGIPRAQVRRGFVPIYRPEVRAGPARPGFASPAPSQRARPWPSPGMPARPAMPGGGWRGPAGVQGPGRSMPETHAVPAPGGGWRGSAGGQAPARPAPPSRLTPAPRFERPGSAPRQMGGGPVVERERGASSPRAGPAWGGGEAHTPFPARSQMGPRPAAPTHRGQGGGPGHENRR